MVDGKIRIPVGFDTEEAEKGLDGLIDTAHEFGDSVEQAGSQMDNVFSGKSISTLDRAFLKANEELKKTKAELKEIDDAIAKVEAETDKDLSLLNGDADRQAIDAVLEIEEAQLEEIRKKQEDLNAKAKEYEDEIRAINNAIEEQRTKESNLVAAKEAAKQEKAAATELARQEKEAVKAKAAEEKKAAVAAKEAAKQKEKAKKATKEMTSSLSAGIKKLGKMATAVVGIRAAYNLIRKAASQYLSQNEELSNKLSACWNVVGQAIGPVVELIVNGISKAIAYVNAFIKALTGVDLVAKANAAALKKQGKAAQEASQTAGFDEINKLSDQSSASYDGGAVTFDTSIAEANISKMEASIAKLKNGISSFISDLSNKYAPSIDAWSGAFEKIKLAAEESSVSLEESLGGLLDNTLGPLSSYVCEEWAPDIGNATSEAFAPFLGDVLSVAIDEFAKDFEFACWGIDESVDHIVKPALEDIEIIWSGLCDGFSKAWEESGSEILDNWQEFKEGIRSTVKELWEKYVAPIVDNIFLKVKELWDEHLKPLWDNISSFLASCWKMILILWNNVLKPVIDWILATIWPSIKGTIDAIVDIVSVVIGFISDQISAIMGFLGGLCDFISGIFSGDLKMAANGIIKMINSIISGVVKGVQGLVNVIIGIINKIISSIYYGIAKVVNGIGSLVGKLGSLLGFDWGFSIPEDPPQIPKVNWDPPKIPMLAVGGIVNNPGRGVTATIGEAGAEAVLPLDRNTEWMDALAEKINNGNSKNIVVQVILSGKKIHEEMINLDKQRNFATNGAI